MQTKGCRNFTRIPAAPAAFYIDKYKLLVK